VADGVAKVELLMGLRVGGWAIDCVRSATPKRTERSPHGLAGNLEPSYRENR